MTLRDAWDEQAENWVRWARAPGHDSYWTFHRERFFELVPAPGRLTLDVGCGEGRLTRDLKARGHRVVGVDASEAMLRHAREADPEGDYVLADAASLPFGEAEADLAIAFMSLQDVDDMPGAVRELARVLEAGGRACVAVVHPVNSAATMVDREGPNSPLLLEEPYFERRRYEFFADRDGLQVTFHSFHWPLSAYTSALEEAGFLIEALREVTQPDHRNWWRFPLFLHVRAVKA